MSYRKVKYIEQIWYIIKWKFQKAIEGLKK